LGRGNRGVRIETRTGDDGWPGKRRGVSFRGQVWRRADDAKVERRADERRAALVWGLVCGRPSWCVKNRVDVLVNPGDATGRRPRGAADVFATNNCTQRHGR
jgi:hypothetical protein